MYLPEHFQENEIEQLYCLIKLYPLGSLIIHANGELEANHLPFELDIKNNQLRAHIAKANPLYELLKQNESIDTLIIFQAENSYISPNWYLEKAIHHRAVPTWNYRVVHIRGKCRFVDDEKYLRGVLARLTREHENSQPVPWRMTDAPEDYIRKQLANIAAIEINILDIKGKFKLSQNRTEADIRNVAQALTEQHKTELAEEMLKQLNK
ncbi:FMN-binding negative transcriptional regulator [Acinetobacter stercoris]|uniref:Protease synthase and sporulation protein PAI 2 n=1 Tax=Acinetobacter stercoris TaxID=2126983 RepID=A0A2U3N3R7_9GAMM|nr:FMN-binding negative transcriptional regulator [Acinetobacter stercoris]SPL72318.1 Protease synthase and sporulation protein PAI 2 [Acinetobacter stercoris]